MNAWQPIESAPKDGTEILIGRWYPGGWYQCVVKWKGEWQLTETGSYAEDCIPDMEPSHWCEIPQPPSLQTSPATPL